MKPRSDSKLKGLPEDRQEQIIAWTRVAKTEEHPGGLAWAQEQLAAAGLKVSISTLSEFVSWWGFQQRFTRAAARASQVAELVAKRNPDFTPQQVRELAQSVFTMEALDAGDAETYVRLESLKLSQDSARTRASLEERKLALAGRRVQLLEENAAKAKAALEGIKTKGGLTPETLKQIEEAAGLL